MKRGPEPTPEEYAAYFALFPEDFDQLSMGDKLQAIPTDAENGGRMLHWWFRLLSDPEYLDAACQRAQLAESQEQVRKALRGVRPVPYRR